MEKTNKNLINAFSGESEANRKYLAFAQKAEKDSLLNLARLFRVVAEGETIHALNHLKKMGEVKDTKSNLEASIAGETYETETMYPEFIRDAEEEKQASAKTGFEWAFEVEKIHKGLFNDALGKIEKGDIDAKDYYVCFGCGYPALDEAPEKCPVCGGPRELFERIS